MILIDVAPGATAGTAIVHDVALADCVVAVVPPTSAFAEVGPVGRLVPVKVMGSPGLAWLGEMPVMTGARTRKVVVLTATTAPTVSLIVSVTGVDGVSPAGTRAIHWLFLDCVTSA